MSASILPIINASARSAQQSLPDNNVMPPYGSNHGHPPQRSALFSVLLATVALALPGLPLHALSEDPITPTQLDEDLVEAFGDVRDMEQRLLGLQRMLPEDRYREAERMRRDLERLVDDLEGTRWENQAVFWLADWHYGYGDTDEVARLISRLLSLKRPAYQAAGRSLLARVLLRQGRIREARDLAEALAAYAPEFMPVLSLVAFHEQVGEPAPITSGRALQGASEPLNNHPESWFLYTFTQLGNPGQRHHLERIITELKRPEYTGQIRPVIVTFDGDPLGTLTHLRLIEGGQDVDVLWANPNPSGDADAWRRLWSLPELPVSVLIARDGSIMAIAPTLERLRPLVGLDPDNGTHSKSSNTGSAWRFQRRGRYADK